MINYKKAQTTDIEEIVNLGYELALFEKQFEPLLVVNESTKQKSRSRYLKQLKDKNANFFIAKSDGDIVGYIYGFLKKYPTHLNESGNLGYLEAIYVDEKFRDKGIAKKLASMILTWFQGRGVKTVELGVYSENSISIQMWEKFGFKAHHSTLIKKL
jgi:ribosomal protein S18 acetylase RimI-like enzyme